MVNNPYFTRSLRSLVNYFSTLEEIFGISARPCNILSLFQISKLLPLVHKWLFETTIFIAVFRKLVISNSHLITAFLKMFLFPCKGLFQLLKTVTPLSLKCYYDHKSFLVLFFFHISKVLVLNTRNARFHSIIPRQILFILTAFFSFNGQQYLVWFSQKSA